MSYETRALHVYSMQLNLCSNKGYVIINFHMPLYGPCHVNAHIIDNRCQQLTIKILQSWLAEKSGKE